MPDNYGVQAARDDDSDELVDFGDGIELMRDNYEGQAASDDDSDELVDFDDGIELMWENYRGQAARDDDSDELVDCADGAKLLGIPFAQTEKDACPYGLWIMHIRSAQNELILSPWLGNNADGTVNADGRKKRFKQRRILFTGQPNSFSEFTATMDELIVPAGDRFVGIIRDKCCRCFISNIDILSGKKYFESSSGLRIYI